MLEALHRHGNGLDTNIYSSFKPIPKTVMDVHAKQYAAGYHSKPWDIYTSDLDLEPLAQKKLETINNLVGQKQGLLISISVGTKPVAFSFITEMNLFVTAVQGKTNMLADSSNQVSAYLKRISREITGSDDLLGIVETGYIADVVVAKECQGKDIGKKMMKITLDCLSEEGRDSAIAWTVNPVMGHIFSDMGGKLIVNVGNEGEGINILPQGTDILPIIEKPFLPGVVADHYLLKLIR